jgi:8-oxo-dGTP pyrophosphatase MutT (NUDIX family)
MVKRHHQIDFASGALVFPGGKTHADDHDPAWQARSLGWDGADPLGRPLRIAAIREAYEETGILLARHADGSAFQGELGAAAARDDIAHNRRAFLDLVGSLDLKLDLAALTVFARWITPELMPKRFDTWFFIAAAPADQLALCDGWETVDAEWIAPAEALCLAVSGRSRRRCRRRGAGGKPQTRHRGAGGDRLAPRARADNSTRRRIWRGDRTAGQRGVTGKLRRP